MKCFHCGQSEMVKSTTTYYCKIGNKYIIIENVPCETCEACGEEYFSASVMEKIEAIIDSIGKGPEKVKITDYINAGKAA